MRKEVGKGHCAEGLGGTSPLPSGDTVRLGPQGFLRWITIMLVCIQAGFVVYVAVMMNYTMRSMDKSPIIILLSSAFLAMLNAYVIIYVRRSLRRSGFPMSPAIALQLRLLRPSLCFPPRSL